MVKELVDHYGIPAQLDIMQEECAELVKACSKVKRASGIGYITPTDPQQTMSDLIEEMAHVKNTIMSTCYLLHLDEKLLDQEIERSDKVSVERLKKMGWDPAEKKEKEED